MATTNRLSRLMKMSWVIQKRNKRTRSKSLMAAWAILQNEDITIEHLTLRLNGNRPVQRKVLNQMSIFNQ